MVKQLLSSDHSKIFLKLLLILIIGLFIYPLGQTGCDRNNIPWQLDLKYSRYLTVMGPEYERMTGTKSADTVDAIRIYKITDKRYQWYSIRELFKKDLVFETKDKLYIKQIVMAAQEDIKDLQGCNRVYKNQEFDQFYVVMFDNTFMRIGYFLLTVCSVQGKEYREIRVPDESGFGPIVYHNESLISILKTIHP